MENQASSSGSLSALQADKENCYTVYLVIWLLNFFVKNLVIFLLVLF